MCRNINLLHLQFQCWELCINSHSSCFFTFRFSFPGIFIFYQMLSSMVYFIVYLINYVDFKALLCGSRNLLESLMPGNETPMCIISGTYQRVGRLSM